MLQAIKLGQTSFPFMVKILSSTTGNGLTGLTNVSAGLFICVRASNQSAGVHYSADAGEILGITTLGTYVAPTAGKCRLKEVDSTYHKGVYEIQLLDSLQATASAKSIVVSLYGATGMLECDALIPLHLADPYESRLTVRAAGVLDEVAQSTAVGTSTITLRAGSPPAQIGSIISLRSPATYAGVEATVTNYNTGTLQATVDPPWPGGAPGSNPIYDLYTSPNALVTTPPEMTLTAVAMASLVDLIWDEVMTTGHAVTDSAAVRLTAAGSASDPLGNSTGSYSAGTIGAAISRIPIDPADASDLAGLIDLLPTAAETVTALKADAEWKTILANCNGQVSIVEPGSYPGNVVLTVSDKTGGVTRATLTLNCLTRPSVLSRVSS